MSDVPIPSYRIRSSAEGSGFGSSRRMLIIAAVVLAVAGLGMAVVFGIGRLTSTRSVPVIEADQRPVRVRPSEPGGLQVPNQSELIFNRDARQRDAAAQGRSAALAPQSEAPDIARLRQQASPPPAPRPAVPAPTQAPTQAPTAPTPAPARPQVATAEPASAPRSPAVNAAARPGGRPTVQLGALSSEAAARGEWDRLARLLPAEFQGRQPTIAAFPREGQSTLYRLRAAGLADAEAARAFCEKIRARGGACAIIGG